MSARLASSLLPMASAPRIIVLSAANFAISGGGLRRVSCLSAPSQRALSLSSAVRATSATSRRRLLFSPVLCGGALMLRPDASPSRSLWTSGGARLADESKPSLADQILEAKRQESKEKAEGGQQQKGAEGGEGEDKAGYKPISKWQKRGYFFFGASMAFCLVGNGILFSLPDKDEQGMNIEDEYSSLPAGKQHFMRLKGRFFQTKKDMEEPFSDKLLPDPLTEPYYQPKYTILLELTGLLVHSNWTHKHGWRFQKRPGVDMFLSQIGYPNFEVVIYTTENAMTFFPIVDGLDPDGRFIMYRLFRDATRYVNGQHTKDLSALNRDLKKVIVVDWNERACALNRDNSLVLKKWEGDNSDRALIGLAQLLQAIKESDVDDVRGVLEYYKQYEDPIAAFRENQRRLQVEMEEEEKKKQAEQSKGSLFSSFGGFRRVTP